MSKIIYVPIIKTSDAEIRAIYNLSDDIKKIITPLFVLTKYRKSKRDQEGDIYKRLKKVEEVFGNRRFIIDLTTEPNQTNTQIENMHDTRNGYQNWIEFLLDLKNSFHYIIPVIQISDVGVTTENEFYDRIKEQVKSLDKHFNNFVYRFPLEYEFTGQDISQILYETLPQKIICVIDCGYIPQNKHHIYSEKAIGVISKLNKLSINKIVLTGTSFPKNPIEHGSDEEGDYNLEEWLLYKNISEKKKALIYGDYATINPFRSMQAGGSGWVPRIDLPSKTKIRYRRSRKTKYEKSYSPAYIRVAQNVSEIKDYNTLRKKYPACWGLEQIELASEGYPQGLSPSFWISVRMNIHITRRIALL